MRRHTYRYRAWDNLQSVQPLTPERVLSALADSLLSGNIEQSLDRALHRGLGDVDGESTAGLDLLRDQLRSQRSALDDEISSNQTLQDLIHKLAGMAGGSFAPDPESGRLLDALQARPDAARLLASLPPDGRELLDAAIRQRSAPGGGGGNGELTDVVEFAGWLDSVTRRLHANDALERQLRLVRRVQDVEEIDDSLIRDVLGTVTAEQFERLTRSLSSFAESGLIGRSGRQQRLSARALQHIGDELLAQALQRTTARGMGDRHLGQTGQHEMTGSSRDYVFGDPLALDLSRTVMRAIRRGGGVPVRVSADDFSIFEREDTARAATVLMLDLSRSMGERGYLLTAKKLCLAILTLIRTRFPRDVVDLAAFSDTARSVAAYELPHLTWDRFGLGTNVQDALRLGRALLAPHRGMQRNVILLTDGEPTAHRDAAGAVTFRHPTTPETLAHTYAEADGLRRDGIHLWVCVLSNDMQVVTFADRLARTAAGELIVTAPDDLSAVLALRYRANRTR
jgi:Mg-chelatase subunit ChlD